jgi:hypothetical protein
MQSTATSNLGLGTGAVDSITTGDYNVGVGDYALTNVTSGAQNIAIGSSALYNNTTGIYNTSVGHQSLNSNTSGGYNVAIGKEVLRNNTTGANNTAVGAYSLFANTTAQYNVAVGRLALASQVGGGITQNVAVGNTALEDTTTGINNVALGASALGNNTTGGANTALGHAAGVNITTGNDNIIIGANISSPSATASNQLNIGNTIYGNTSTGKVGIGTATPAEKLDVNGTLACDGLTPTHISPSITSTIGTAGSNGEYWKLGSITFNNSQAAKIRVGGTQSYSSGSNISGETVIHLRGSSSTSLLEGHFYGNTQGNTTINAVRYVNTASDTFDIYVRGSTYHGIDTWVETSGTWTPSLSNTGSTVAPTGSVGISSLYTVTIDGSERMRINTNGHMQLSEALVIQGGNLTGFSVSIPGNSTRTFTMNATAAGTSVGLIEVTCSFYGSGGSGTGLIKVVDGGHWGGTNYHQAIELARWSNGVTISSLTETSTGWSYTMTNNGAAVATGNVFVTGNLSMPYPDIATIISIT